MELERVIDEIASEAPDLPRGLIARAAKAGYVLALPRRKQSPDGLQFLQDDMAKKAGRLTQRLGAGEIDQAAWEKEMQALIARYHTAALMLGQGSDEIDAQAAEILLNMTDDQFAYLANFGAEMVSAAEWQEGYAARAESYAGAIKEPYWTGEVDFLPLPAMPAQGTQCRCITDPAVRVLTSRGEIPIMEVVVGDLVLTHRMRWRPVVRTIVTGSLPHHRQAHLVVAGRRAIGCTADHHWLTAEGWTSASNIRNMQLPVYNGRHEDLRDLRPAAWEQEQGDAMLDLQGDLLLPLRPQEGLAGSGMRVLWKEPNRQGPVEKWPTQDACIIEGGGLEAARTIRRPGPSKVAEPRGRAEMELVLVGRRDRQEAGLPLSVGVDQGQWSHPAGHGSASQERRSVGRSSIQPGTDESRGPWSSPHDGRAQGQDATGQWQDPRRPDVPLRPVRPGLPFEAVQAQILLDGLLPVGTPLYDLEVAEDHSFVLEGTISHNSNCGCSWEIEVIDADEGDYDCFWRRSKDDSCATCLEREAQWSPVRIRGGLLE